MKRDEVMELADAAALLFQQLLEKEVPLEAAIKGMTAFVSSSVLKASGGKNDEPREEWQE